MGAMAVAFGVQHDLDLECLVHFTTRDRNLMALESELLGAHALGVRNILALTGDPPRIGDYPTGTGIWDVDSIGLIGILSRLNRGEDQAGKPIGAPAGFTIACALDPTADDIDHEIERLAAKLEAGADLIMTQPIYAREQWDRFMDRAASAGRAGCRSRCCSASCRCTPSRHAEFLHNEVPGITIPDEVRAAMHAAGERGAEVGLEMAHALLEQLAPRRPGHVHHAQLRPLRAGRRAGPARQGRHAHDDHAHIARGATQFAREAFDPERGRRCSSCWPARAADATRWSAISAAGHRRSGLRQRRTSCHRRPSSWRLRPSPASSSAPAPRSSFTRSTSPARPRSRPNADAIALVDQWGVGRAGFDDGLAIMWNTNRQQCQSGVSGNGQVQLYAGPGYRAAFLSNAERQQIFDEDMVPHLRVCDEDEALLAALEKIDANATPEHAQVLAAARIIDAIVGLIVGAAAVPAPGRLGGVVVAALRARPGLPRQPVDPDAGATARADRRVRRGGLGGPRDATRADHGDARSGQPR